MSTKKFIVFTGPSGVGKATIENILFKDEELNLCLSCSATTRKPREGEVNGVHYHFLSMDDFNEKIEEGEFIEWNSHFSNKYGTLKSEIENIQQKGSIPFLEVEPIGAKNIMSEYEKEDIISFFISPPSLEVLTKRIKNRGTENEVQVNERLARVKEEYEFKKMFQHEIINDSIERAATEIKKIILEEL